MSDVKDDETDSVEAKVGKVKLPSLDWGGFPHVSRSDLIYEMRKAGLAKPDNVTHAEWKQNPHKLLPWQRSIVYLAACGKDVKFIAEQVGKSAARLHELLDSPKYKKLVERERMKLFGLNARKRMENMVNKAMDVIDDIIDDEDKPTKYKLDAAKYVIDQGIGKAKQEIEHSGSMLSDFMDRVDKAVDITPAKAADDIDNFVEGLAISHTVGAKNEAE